jgi:hypothetical protein
MAAVSPAEHELQMLGPMVACAQALGLRFGEAAKAEPDVTRSVELADAFHKSFLAVRMGIRLSMALRAAPKPARAEAAERLETEGMETDRPERDPPETERLEPLERERERDGEYEAVSLPKFLATLRGVAADARRVDMPADVRAGATTLEGLLARAASGPAAATERPSPGVALLTRPPPVAGRSVLLGSATRALPGPGLPRPPPRRSG